MRLSLLAALAAATALIPAAASAQDHDRGNWHHNGGDRGDRGDRGGNRPAPPAQRPAAPARPDFNRDGGRPAFQQDARAPRPQFDRGPAARPDQPARAPQPGGFQRPDAGRPAQVRPDGNWHAEAGGSHFADRDDRNDSNRNRGGQWSGNRDDRGQWDRGNDRDGRWDHRDDRGGQWNRGNDRRPDRDWRNGNHGSFDHSWRHDNRYNWQRYRDSHRSVYRLPRYYAPYGWDYGYRRFNIGFRLDTILFGSNYWISDPYYYRLPPAYGPYRWVRYYNDALLVDIRTGYVVDVVYGIFW
ncbi:MAG TPA: RcnB family protein [Sphingomonas sp.]